MHITYQTAIIQENSPVAISWYLKKQKISPVKYYYSFTTIYNTTSVIKGLQLHPQEE